MNRYEPIPIDDYQRMTSEPTRPHVSFTRTNTVAIMATAFEPIRWTVDGYVPEGLSVLAGRQKLGKTWLAIDWALAVATGGYAMGSVECEAGDVLYIDMENGPRRIQRRIATLYPNAEDRPDLSRLEWVTDAPALDKGFIEALDGWRQSVRQPRLVIIDVLQRIKPAGNASRNSYENDYAAWSPLQRWATEHGIAIVGLHHTRKGGADDPLESLSGSNGLSACADTTLVLDRDSSGTTLYVRGRDVDEKETAMLFSGGLWTITGDAAAVRRTTERSAILDALEGADEPMSPGEIAIAASMKRNNVDYLLHQMGKAGEVLKAGRGKYVHPDRKDLLSGNDDAGGAKNAKKQRNGEDRRSIPEEPVEDEGFALDLVNDADLSGGHDIPKNDEPLRSEAKKPEASQTTAEPNQDKGLPDGQRTDLSVLSDLSGGDPLEGNLSPKDNSTSVLEWSARAKALLQSGGMSVGSGKGKTLTSEGVALFREMIDAGCSPTVAGRVVGITKQSACTRAKKLREAAHG
ncbi:MULTISPECIES: AAA family ATPase [unclassified Xanthobacter]|uniref:AAA family ATPase n=1 Tax=unclassified Xanthobacter TaxID=2623496 RepID=UPI001F45FBBC|nr:MULTISPECIES: AAA family ATPase [unclassified Xanthobacter]